MIDLKDSRFEDFDDTEPKIDKQILLLASRMLELASNEFANHGCNDLDNETLELVSNETELCKQIEEWNGDEGYPEKIYNVSDWMLMDFLKDKLKESAED